MAAIFSNLGFYDYPIKIQKWGADPRFIGMASDRTSPAELGSILSDSHSGPQSACDVSHTNPHHHPQEDMDAVTKSGSGLCFGNRSTAAASPSLYNNASRGDSAAAFFGTWL